MTMHIFSLVYLALNFFDLLNTHQLIGLKVAFPLFSFKINNKYSYLLNFNFNFN